MRPVRVTVLLVPPVVAYDAVIPVQVFGEAIDPSGGRLFEVSLATPDGRVAATNHGFAITPHGGGHLVEDADIVMVPGTHSPGPRYEGWLPEDVGRVLAGRRADARVASICTGAFVLAAAGLLDGRSATTHWDAADELGRLYPQVDVDPQVLFVDDGDVLTSAGLTAGVDLCLHLVRAEAGAEVANHVARHMVVPSWRDGGQAQFIDAPLPRASGASTAAARTWALAHLESPVTLRHLAHEASMSVRTFNRRFRAETGQTPGAWLAQQRVHRARRLLETSDLTIDQIAARSGFGTAASLRLHLRSAVGTSPSAYRAAFRVDR